MININDLQLRDLLPSSLKSSADMLAICDALQPEFDEIIAAIPQVLFIPNIHNQPPAILEHLAWERNLDAEEGWELSDSEEQKINLILNAFQIQRYKGTKFAIRKALELVGIEAEIQPWFNYGGQPFNFKVIINRETAFSFSKLQLLDRYINKSQSARDLGTIEIMFNVSTKLYFAGGCTTQHISEVRPLLTTKQFISIACGTEIFSEPPILN